MSLRLAGRAAVLSSVLALLGAGPAGAASTDVLDNRQEYEGTQKLRYEFGPVTVRPGQNTIDFAANTLKPEVPGYITRFKPNLIYADTRTVPRVDVVHLHHGVWVVKGKPTFAAGEEKTIASLPRGFGIHHDPKDPWIMNTMIHNPTPTATKVYVVYELDFVPDDAPGAAAITPAKIQWLDVAGIKAYPVFDVKRGSGTAGRFTFPLQAKGAEREKIGQAATWEPGRDITLIQTAGHVHPGGLWAELSAERNGAARELFRSEAKYFDPSGPVSWDMAMTATPPGWRVAVNAGDRLKVSTTYESRRASWYESMGIMPVVYTEGHVPGAADPFAGPVPTRGRITHGALPENNNKGGDFLGLPDARTLRSGSVSGPIPIRNFAYGAGDLRRTGRAGRPPAVRAGRSLVFDNAFDDARGIMHTITGCRWPCNRSTGIAYPLANGADFDSGNLGTGPPAGTAASNRLRWQTPKDLKPGTYSYFCRVHPFMRGAFRVVPARTK